ncbi:MAG: hypothetical protein K2N28_07120 [Muribaculaceae bacterium]|nr:hypothetical protein [Muribaculaceae bacterium]
MRVNELQANVERMVSDLLIKIEKSVPDRGNFPMVYSEFKITDSEMCLTDVMLKLQALPEHLPNHETDRWLELVGYKLPVPFKATRVMLKGTKQEVIRYLKQPESLEKILSAIPQLNDNLIDV